MQRREEEGFESRGDGGELNGEGGREIQMEIEKVLYSTLYSQSFIYIHTTL